MTLISQGTKKDAHNTDDLRQRHEMRRSKTAEELQADGAIQTPEWLLKLLGKQEPINPDQPAEKES